MFTHELLKASSLTCRYYFLPASIKGVDDCVVNCEGCA